MRLKISVIREVPHRLVWWSKGKTRVIYWT